jgi:hypothetical protein
MASKTKRRSKGTGSIIKLPSGYYAYQYLDEKGKRKTESLKVKSRSRAQKLADERAEVVTAGDEDEALKAIARATGKLDADPLALDKVWEAFEATHPDCGPGTLSLHKGAWNRFLKWMKENRPNVVDVGDVDPNRLLKND